MATRRTDDGMSFDHGAQYFTVRDERFKRSVRSWEQDGLVGVWDGKIRALREGQLVEGEANTERYVGTPTMTAVCKHLAAQIDVHLGCEIERLGRDNKRWRLVDKLGGVHAGFDVVIVSAPAPQSTRFLAPARQLADLAGSVTMEPCWAVMAAFDGHLPTPFDGAFVHESPLSWVASSSSKPARPRNVECWVLHGSPAWSREYAEAAPEEVNERLLEEFWRVTGLGPVPPRHTAAHRWRYALPPEPLERRCLFDDDCGLGACGDWCSGPRVEGAFLSGLAAAECVLRAASTGSLTGNQ